MLGICAAMMVLPAKTPDSLDHPRPRKSAMRCQVILSVAPLTISSGSSRRIESRTPPFAPSASDGPAKTVSSVPLNSAVNNDTLRDAAKALYLALDAEAADSKDDDISKMTPREKMLLLHIME
jgi:hypothetical protein